MSLRVKYVNSALEYKTCFLCKKSFPRNEDYFYKVKHRTTKNSFKYSSYCIKCERIRNQEWKKKDSASGRKRERQRQYLSTENGYFRELWQGVKKSTHGCLFRNFEEFFQCWIEQQKIYGTKCPYLGMEMTRIKCVNINGKRATATDTNISKDRILSNLPYGKDNLMFVSWKANNEKGNITPFIARKYLELIESRPLIKHMMQIDNDKILNKHGDYFNEVKSKEKVIKLVDRADIHVKDENNNSFFTKELDKLRESLSEDEMRQFYEVAYASHVKEKQQKEKTRQLIKLKHAKKNET
jgi:hypothetical protein